MPRDWTRQVRSLQAKTKLYDAVNTLGGDANEALQVNVARMVSPTDHDDITSQVEWDAHMRDYRALRRQVLAEVRAQLTDIFAQFNDAGSQLEGLTIEKMRFSDKAGCSCGCSPGFIIDGVVTYLGTPVDLYLNRVKPVPA